MASPAFDFAFKRIFGPQAAGQPRVPLFDLDEFRKSSKGMTNADYWLLMNYFQAGAGN